MVRNRIAWAVAVICALSTVAGACWATPGVGSNAPNFTLGKMGGGTFTLSNCWTGTRKIVLLDFWASWCNPCKAGIPGLKAISSDYAAKDVIVVGVAIDNPSSIAYNYATSVGINYTICGDPNFGITGVYDSGSIPQSYIIDKTGVVRYAQTGYYGNEDAIRAQLDRLTVPEPSSLYALVMGIIGAGGLALRRRRS